MANNCRLLILLVLTLVVDSQSKRLLNKVKKLSNNENILVSPFLLGEGLAQLYLGSEGTTAEELKNVIPHLTHNPDMNIDLYLSQDRSILQTNEGNSSIKFGNRIFADKSVHIYEEYETKISKIFQAKTQNVDFRSDSSKKEINDWVAQQTNNMIPEAIKELTGDEILMLVSTIYFKGVWKEPFSKEATRKAPFLIPQAGADPRTVEVDFMRREGLYEYAFIADLNAEVVSLPYAGSNISMIILLPKAVNGSELMLDNLGGMDINILLESTQEQSLILSLPKFKYQYSVDLVKVLEDIGVKEIFSNANLNGMTNSTNVKVNRINQEAFIDVNEEGTEDPNIQTDDAESSSAPLNLNINHPFVFYIKDAKTIYFSGEVNDPSA